MDVMLTIAGKSKNPEFIEYAFNIGIRKFRINMDYEQDALEAIKILAQARERGAVIFADFQGVKRRIFLADGQTNVEINSGDIQIFHLIPGAFPWISNCESLAPFLQSGDTISISDDRICGEIIKVDDNKIYVRYTSVTYKLRQNAGCNFETTNAPQIHMTRAACEHILASPIIQENLCDWVILSFVQSASDVTPFISSAHAKNIKTMAKVETPEGIHNLKEIMDSADGIMIGRGDLKSFSKENFNKYYDEALQILSSSKHGYCGVGTFFLSHYSDSAELLDEEMRDLLRVKELNLDYIMLSKEVVNSKYPYETTALANKLAAQ